MPNLNRLLLLFTDFFLPYEMKHACSNHVPKMFIPSHVSALFLTYLQLKLQQMDWGYYLSSLWRKISFHFQEMQ